MLHSCCNLHEELINLLPEDVTQRLFVSSAPAACVKHNKAVCWDLIIMHTWMRCRRRRCFCCCTRVRSIKAEGLPEGALSFITQYVQVPPRSHVGVFGAEQRRCFSKALIRSVSLSHDQSVSGGWWAHLAKSETTAAAVYHWLTGFFGSALLCGRRWQCEILKVHFMHIKYVC